MTTDDNGESVITNLKNAIVSKVTSLISTHNSDTNSHSDIRNSIPSPSTSNPLADTTSGSVGNSATYAKANHTHPKSDLYDVTVEKQEEAETGFVATYVIKQNNTQVGSKINIPKDFLVKSATMQNCVTANSPLNGLNVGDPYLDFVVNTVDDDETDNHIYINVSDLVNDSRYTASTGLTLTNNAFSVNYGTTAGTACAGNDSRLSNARTPTSHTHKDEDILYNSSTQDKLTPLDMAFVSNTNKLAYLPASRIQIWTTADSGSTWNQNVGTNAQKINLVTTQTDGLAAGNGSTANYGQNQIRISLVFGDVNQNSTLYAHVAKLLVRIGTHGALGTTVTVYIRKYNTSSFTNEGTYNINGWTGWNAIPLNKIVGGYASQTNGSTNNIQEIVLHFKQNNSSTGNLKVYEIKMVGEKIYAGPSQLGKTGHLYDMNENQDAIFPAKIIKSGGTSSQFLKANGSVETLNTTTATVTYTDGSTGTINLVTR